MSKSCRNERSHFQTTKDNQTYLQEHNLQENNTISLHQVMWINFDGIENGGGWLGPFNSFAVLPFINGVTQPQTRILRRHDIQVASKPFKTLQQEFPSPKFRLSIKHQPYVIYKISGADCD